MDLFFHLPSRYISRIIASKRIFVVHRSGCTGTFLWLNTVPADVKLLAVVWMCKRWVRKCSSARSCDFTIWTGETVVQDI